MSETTSSDPLDAQATPVHLHQLAQVGYLDASAFERALSMLGVFPSKTGWQKLINLLLLFLGVALVLAGIIFFFANNWASMGKFLKFGLLEALILLAVLGAWQQGLDRLTGKALLLVAAILPGPLMAVYGQTYQTGADAYELFVNWTLLIVGWVLISRFAPLWLVWIILVNTSVILYWMQILHDMSTWTLTGLFDLLCVLNALALIIWEMASARNVRWLKGRWMPQILICAAMLALVIAAILAMFDDAVVPFRVVAALLCVGAFGGCLWFYQTKIRDLFMLAVCLLSGLVIVTAFLIRLLGWDEPSLYLFYGILVVGQAAAVVFWLRHIQQRWEETS